MKHIQKMISALLNNFLWLLSKLMVGFAIGKKDESVDSVDPSSQPISPPSGYTVPEPESIGIP